MGCNNNKNNNETMGFLVATLRFMFLRLVPALILALAVFIGWLNVDTPIPEGKLFQTIYPLMKGKLPSTLLGHGTMTGTPPVPDDMTPQPRPDHELFVELPGGYQMPQNGIGMCCRPTAYDDVLVERTVLWYLLLGGRHIDGAHLYLNHKAIGKGIQEAMKRGVPRSEIFVTTKVFPSFFGYNSTKEIVPTFLEELQLEYIDLILLHMPVHPADAIVGTSKECSANKWSKKGCRQQTWRALSELREQGLVRNVGVSNFVMEQLKDLTVMRDMAPVANNQIMFNPWLSDDWLKSYHFCVKKNITVTGYNSLGGSLQHHSTHSIEVLTELAKKHNRSVAQILLRWTTQKNVTVIPGTGNPEYMKDNLSIYAFELSKEETMMIDELRTAEGASKFMSTPRIE